MSYRKRQPSSSDEAGFTLIELLVVILIIGILAAIAIPSFLNQKSKANDASAKSQAGIAARAVETYSVNNNGSYEGATKAELQKLEPTLTDVATATLQETSGLSPTTYTVKSKSNATGDEYIITREAGGAFKRTCTTAGKGACPASGTW